MTSSGNKFRRLEEDFNDGDPIDLTQYRNVLSFTGSMGFTAEDAVEASLVLQTTENLQQITDYLLSPEQEKQKSYMKRKAECQLACKVSPEQEKRIDELKRLHREIEQERFKSEQLAQEMIERQEVTKLEKCVEFLRGIIADEMVTDAEFEALEVYKRNNKVDEGTFVEALDKLDYTPQELEDIHKNPDDSGGRKCIMCNVKSKEWCIFPCMHVVLCGECAIALKAGGGGPGGGGPGGGAGECPACGKPIKEIKRVYCE